MASEGDLNKVDGDILYAADISELISRVGTNDAQSAYEQVKADSTNWTNTDYLGADIFSDSNGAKNTIDTGSSTALYISTDDTYQLASTGTEEETVLDNFNDGTVTNWSVSNATTGTGSVTDFNETSYSGYLYGYAASSSSSSSTGTANMTAEYSDTDLDVFGKTVVIELDYNVTGSSSYLIIGGGAIIYINNIQLFGRTISGYGGTQTATGAKVKIVFSNIQALVYLDTGAGYVLDATVDISSLTRANAHKIKFHGYANSATAHPGSASTSMKINNVWIDNYSSSAVETNTIINEIVPKSIVVYGKADIPADTSIIVDVSDDGGSTFALTGKSLNTAIDTSTFTTGDLAIKFNLATTDTSVTPKLYGYGVAITNT